MPRAFLTVIVIIVFICGCRPNSDSAATDSASVLLESFPGYAEIISPRDYEAPSIRALGNYDDGVLVADFNSDDVHDFAAKIRRPLTVTETGTIRERDRESVTFADAIVACNGPPASGGSCFELVKPTIGGIAGVLDFFVWEADAQSLESPPECASKVDARSGQKLLTLVEVHGLCATVFLPLDGGGYDSCVYCAD
jgi:hypothetical protein